MDLSGFDQPGNFTASNQRQYKQPQQQNQPASSGGLGGFLKGVGNGLISMPKYFLNADIVNPIKQTAAQLTGNKTAYQNANQSANQNLGLGPNGTNIGNATKKFIGNTAQLGLTVLAPGVGEEASSLGGKIAANAALGSGFGASGALSQDNSSVKSVLRGAETGGLVGGATGLATSTLGSMLGKTKAGAASTLTKATAGREAQIAAQDLAPYGPVSNGANISGLLDLIKNKLGIQDIAPATVNNAANMLTGPNGFINGIKQQLISQTEPVNISGLDKVVREAIAAPENAGVLGDPLTKGTAGNSIFNSVLQKADSMHGPEGPGLVGGMINTDTASADNVFKEIQTTADQINNLGNAKPGTLGAATKDVLQKYHDELMNRLSTGTGLNDAIKGYSVPVEDISAIHEAVAKAGLPSTVADYGINALNNAKSLGDIRGAEAPLVQASQLANAADKYANGPGVVQAANKAAGIADDTNPYQQNMNFRMQNFAARDLSQMGVHPIMGVPLAMLGASKAGSSEPISQGITSIFNKAGALNNVVPNALNAAGGAAERGGVATLGNLVPKAGMIGSINNTVQQQAGNTNSANNQSSPEAAPQSFQPGTKVQVGADGKLTAASINGSGDSTKADNPFGVTKDQIAKAMIDDLAKTGGKNLSKLNTIYSLVNANDKASQPKKLNHTAVNQLDATQRASSGIKSIQDAFNNTTETGLGGGILSKILGLSPAGIGVPFGGGVRNVNAAIGNALPDIAKALGQSTASKQELDQIKHLLPSNSDTQASAKAKLDNLAKKIQDYSSQYFNNESNYIQNNNSSADIMAALSALAPAQ